MKELGSDLILKKHGFELGNEIGTGAFAKVKLATWIKNGERSNVAVKVIDLKKAPKVYQIKFLPRELKIWPQLEHSNIIKVYSIVTIRDHIYIFMEYAENGDIVEYLKIAGRVSEKQAKSWILQLLQGLRFCHKRGIAHRDVKCENLLLDSELNLKLSDFGFSKQCLDNKYKRMLSSTFCGTTHYVAPEVIHGSLYNPFRSDVWSVGVCAYVMMNDGLPFKTKDIQTFHKEQMKRSITFPDEVPHSKKCKEFIKRCLTIDPLKRPAVVALIDCAWFKEIR